MTKALLSLFVSLCLAVSCGIVIHQSPDELLVPNGSVSQITKFFLSDNTACGTNCLVAGTCHPNIDESPDSLDVSPVTLVADDGSSNTSELVFEFTDPAQSLSTATNAQTIDLVVSKCDVSCIKDAGGTGVPTYDLDLFCDLNAIADIATGVSITGSDQRDSYDFTVPYTSFCERDGSKYEIRLISSRDGGGGNKRMGCFDAVEFEAEYGDTEDAALAVDNVESTSTWGDATGTDCTDDTNCDSTTCETLLDEDPDGTLDGGIIATGTNNATVFFEFPTPASNPSTVANAQTFKIAVEVCNQCVIDASVPAPGYEIRVFCGSVEKLHLSSPHIGRVNVLTGEVDDWSWTFTADGDCTADGSTVRAEIKNISFTTGADTRETCIEAIEWDVAN